MPFLICLATSFCELWENIIFSLLNLEKEFKKTGFRDKNKPRVCKKETK